MLLFLDEFDSLDPSTGVALNAILDNGGIASVPQRSDNPTARRGDGFLPIIAVNTLQGATSEYTGRMKQDAATMSRFDPMTRVHVDYCKKVERGILSESPELCESLWKLRNTVRKCNMDGSRIPTTRTFYAAALEVAYRDSDDGKANGDGKTDTQIISTLCGNWTSQEKSKAGIK